MKEEKGGGEEGTPAKTFVPAVFPRTVLRNCEPLIEAEVA
jgi:hypothetical protein